MCPALTCTTLVTRPSRDVPEGASSFLPAVHGSPRPVGGDPRPQPLRYGRPTPGPGLGRHPSHPSSRRGARPRPSRRDSRHRHSDTAGPSRPDPVPDGIRVSPGNVAPTGPSPSRHPLGLGRQRRISPVPQHRGMPIVDVQKDHLAGTGYQSAQQPREPHLLRSCP
jgi:hypothetical protein